MVPTNFKLLDPKNMKVNELRHELECRTLNSKGLKSQLIARLTKTLKAEAENEESNAEAEKEAQEEAAAVAAAEAEEEAEEDEEKTKEDEEKKRQEEREKRDLERRFSMPDNPTIVVHPSPTAKGGKFDCALTSLSVLLDYRIEDNKEHSFEVSLFAELFNEMLQRDFAFNIYKALLKAPEKPKDEKKDKDKEKKGDKDKSDKDKDEPKSKKRKTDGDKSSSKDGDKDHKTDEKSEDGDGNDDEDEGEGKSEEDAEDDDKKKDDKKKGDGDHKHRSPSSDSRRVKQETVDPHLLLSCVYFDQNHCGYLLERDLEDISHSIGIGLSRSQVRKLIQKVVSRDSWNYRRITDKPKDRKDSDSSALAAVKIEVNGSLNDEELANGNQTLLSETLSSASSMVKKEKIKSEPVGVSDGLVTYQGAVLDVANLLQRVEKGDHDRITSEKKIQDLEQLAAKLKSNVSSSEDTARGMSADLSDLRKKLSTSEKSSKSSTARANKLKDVIGLSQKSLDEVMLKFNEVLEEDDK